MADLSPASILIQLIQDYHSLNSHGICRYAYPSSVEFSKQVHRGRPCVYRVKQRGSSRGSSSSSQKDSNPSKSLSSSDAETERRSIAASPAFSWTTRSLSEKVDGEVEVAVTPDGRADSLYLIRKSRDGTGYDFRRADEWHEDEDEDEDDGEDKDEGRDRDRDRDRDREHDQNGKDSSVHGYHTLPYHASSSSMHTDRREEEVFLQPASTQMSISDLLSHVTPALTNPDAPEHLPSSSPPPTLNNSSSYPPQHHHHRHHSIYYLQSQNSNLTTPPLSSLYAAIPSTIPFARPVLGEPDAVNIWIGDDRSVTTTHRDPYENLYLVVSGKKTFTLWPPVEELCLAARLVRTGRFVFDATKGAGAGAGDGGGGGTAGTGGTGGTGGDSSVEFQVRLDGDDDDDDDDDGNKQLGEGVSEHNPISPSSHDSSAEPRPRSPSDSSSHEAVDARIPWIPIDPLLPRSHLNHMYPHYRHARPETVTVEAGEMLYLPAGWFHHVRQECGVWHDGSPAPCVAVNYWFDMEYEGERYAFHQLVTRLVEQVRQAEEANQ